MSDFISFPPGKLGDTPQRLPVLGQTEDVIGLNKPAGFGVARDGLRLAGPTLLEALRESILAGKPQLSALGIRYAGCIHGLDAETTGAVLLARHPEAEAFLRNAAGSRQCAFVFDLIAESRCGDSERRCELPLAEDPDRGRAVVSRDSGRKCGTTFVRVRQFEGHAHWEARTRDLRPHQIRVHAAQSGLRIPGEDRYGAVRPIFLSDLKRDYQPRRRVERPVHAPLCLHLREVSCPLPDGARITLVAPFPRSFGALLRQLERLA